MWQENGGGAWKGIGVGAWTCGLSMLARHKEGMTLGGQHVDDLIGGLLSTCLAQRLQANTLYKGGSARVQGDLLMS